jgi:hypothetical protein
MLAREKHDDDNDIYASTAWKQKAPAKPARSPFPTKPVEEKRE